MQRKNIRTYFAQEQSESCNIIQKLAVKRSVIISRFNNSFISKVFDLVATKTEFDMQQPDMSFNALFSVIESSVNEKILTPQI